MESFSMHLIFFGVLCVYKAFALPAKVAAPSLVEANVQDLSQLSAGANLALSAKSAAPSLAGANVQDLSQLSAGGNLALSAKAGAPSLAEAKVQDWSHLSAAEKSVGRSIISNLDSILIDPTDHRPGPPRCLDHMDLLLIVDSSGSVGRSQFSRGKRAMKTLVDYVDNRCRIYRYGSQVGLITFSTPHLTHVQFGLGDHTSRSAVNRAIDWVEYDDGSSTATAKALRLAKTEFNQNSRHGNAKVAWIITDGNSNTGGNPRYPADELKRMGVTVCAVAVGDSINMAEINDIASSGCAFRATSFTRYDKIIEFAAAEGRGSRQQSPTLEPDFFSGIQF